MKETFKRNTTTTLGELVLLLRHFGTANRGPPGSLNPRFNIYSPIMSNKDHYCLIDVIIYLSCFVPKVREKDVDTFKIVLLM